MNDYLVSVIVPVYNVRPYLVEALDSLINQSYKNLEIILVDDGSTDGSEIICEEYAKKDERIIVHHQVNKGLSAARNSGLDLMTGEFVAFLDSDDVFLPDYIMNMVETIIREKTDIVICNYSIQTNCGNKKNKCENRAGQTLLPGSYNRASALSAIADRSLSVSVWNKLYKIELWKDIRFAEGHVYEDVEVTLRVFDICRSVFVLDKPLYVYRSHHGSITRINSNGNIKDKILAKYYLYLFVKEHTPEIYSIRQLQKESIRWMKELIRAFIFFIGAKEAEKCYKQKLKKLIIKSVKDIVKDLGAHQYK